MPEPKNKKRILSIDDDDEFNTLLRHRFAGLNCDSDTQSTIEGFLKALTTQKPDLILVDLNIGEVGNGFDVIYKIKANPKWSSIPIVIVSSNNDPKTIAHGLEIGASDYLTKPTDKDRFHILLKKFLDLPSIPEVIADPLRQIYEHASAIEFTLSTYVSEISETGFKILTPQLIRKGTVFYLQGEMVKMLFSQEDRVLCSVLNSEVCAMVDRNYFLIEIEFENLSEKARNSLRGWFLNRQTKT